MNILITGGAGYIGTELVSMLAARKDVERIIIYDNLSRPNYNLFLGPKLQQHKLSFIKGELLDSRSLAEALKGVDVVYHLAAKVTTPFAHDDPHAYEQVNHWGTAELVYAVEESDVQRFFYTSSASVYGSCAGAVDEATAPAPQTFYAISKLAGEKHVARLGDTIHACILRCGNVYGYSRSMRFDAVINRFVFDAHVRNRIIVEGDGHQSRPFIHCRRIASGLAGLLTSSVPAGIYNLVERSSKIIDIAACLKELLPGLECMFINQHLTLHELNVKPNHALNQALGITAPETMQEDLREFLTCFSF